MGRKVCGSSRRASWGNQKLPRPIGGLLGFFRDAMPRKVPEPTEFPPDLQRCRRAWRIPASVGIGTEGLSSVAMLVRERICATLGHRRTALRRGDAMPVGINANQHRQPAPRRGVGEGRDGCRATWESISLNIGEHYFTEIG